MYGPSKPKFYYIKVGFKGVKIIYACFRDVNIEGDTSWACTSAQSDQIMICPMTCSIVFIYSESACRH